MSVNLELESGPGGVDDYEAIEIYQNEEFHKNRQEGGGDINSSADDIAETNLDGRKPPLPPKPGKKNEGHHEKETDSRRDSEYLVALSNRAGSERTPLINEANNNGSEARLNAQDSDERTPVMREQNPTVERQAQRSSYLDYRNGDRRSVRSDSNDMKINLPEKQMKCQKCACCRKPKCMKVTIVILGVLLAGFVAVAVVFMVKDFTKDTNNGEFPVLNEFITTNETKNHPLLITPQGEEVVVEISINIANDYQKRGSKMHYQMNISAGSSEIWKNVLMQGRAHTTSVVTKGSATVVARGDRSETSDRQDSYLLLPELQLGKEYLVMSKTSKFANEEHRPVLYIQSGKAQTNVDIISMQNVSNCETHPLNPFTSLKIREPNDLSGYKISSTKPVSVISSHECLYLSTNKGDGCNAVYEQLLPNSLLGNEFYIPIFSCNKGNFHSVFKIIALEDSTEGKITYKTDDEHEVPFTLSAGEVEEHTQQSVTYIHSGKPCSVSVYMQCRNGQNGTGPIMLNIPSTDLNLKGKTYFSTDMFGSDPATEIYLAVVKQKDTTLKLDSDTFGADWVKIFDKNFQYTNSSIPTDMKTHYLEGSNYMAYLYGGNFAKKTGFAHMIGIYSPK